MESPEHIRLSLAAAMQLGYSPARFHRAARMTCINLLLTYGDGCVANCSYCGLARERRVEGDRSFIRVPWPVRPTDEVLGRIARSRVVKRTCLSMITHRRSVKDSIVLTRRIAEVTGKPVSVLITPTLIEREDLIALRDAGADKIGVAFDLATEELFDVHRGHTARGPHRWNRYWEVFDLGVEVFGERMVGSHFIVGLGETERDMALAFQRVSDRGGVNHLFSFYPEAGSAESERAQPPMAVYRRMQLACELIDAGLARAEAMRFDGAGRIVDFGVAPATLDEVIDAGRAFRTRGCTGEDGEVACNRPYANSLPGDETVRNHPFAPNAADIRRIRAQMGLAPAEAPR
ncbi:radical SAM protein [Candidatus Sumerlaeota bacterium]|nr:radical SAM protein [Candidatus Sumerlaeota bacterium]